LGSGASIWNTSTHQLERSAAQDVTTRDGESLTAVTHQPAA
jgi:hypothetical protein